MFRSKTVFVIGAGASADLGLPLGAGLRNIISAMLKPIEIDSFGNLAGPGAINQALVAEVQRNHWITLNQYIEAAQNIAANIYLAQSIDEFVDHNAGNAAVEFVAKVAICQSILEAEKDSKLLDKRPDRHLALDMTELQKRNAWLIPLWHMLRAHGHRDNPRALFQNASFIIFNYDRCVEEFFVRALIQSCGQSETEARQIVSELDIEHPYGSLGDIATNSIPFGTQSSGDLGSIAKDIQTFGESERDNEKMARIATMLLDARDLVFIGFAFYEQNMTFFEVDRSGRFPQVFATALGLPQEHIPFITKGLEEGWGGRRSWIPRFEFRDTAGASLLNTFRRDLMR